MVLFALFIPNLAELSPGLAPLLVLTFQSDVIETLYHGPHFRGMLDFTIGDSYRRLIFRFLTSSGKNWFLLFPTSQRSPTNLLSTIGITACGDFFSPSMMPPCLSPYIRFIAFLPFTSDVPPNLLSSLNLATSEIKERISGQGSEPYQSIQARNDRVKVFCYIHEGELI
jgi:hypothetical protein